MAFKKATKTESRARIVLMGPSGSGKTRTALEFARVLGTRIAVIDTEKGSAAKYSDRFDFDVDELTTFAPLTYVASIQEAERAGYDVIIVDSLTHAWTGKDGALEQVDKIGARARSGGGNSFTAWKDVTPMHNALIDAMTGSTAHVIATMRSKMEYVIEEDSRGKKVPRKVGMAPVQREGMEYEFDLAIEMDQDHRGVVTKSRCDELADAVMVKPGREWAEAFKAWLSGAPAPAPQRDELALFKAALALHTLPSDAVQLYALRREALQDAGKLGDAKAALRDRVAVLQKCDAAGATAWVVKKLKEIDAPPAREPGDDDDQPDPPAGGSGGSSARSSSAKGSAVAQAPASGPVGLARPVGLPAWLGDRELEREHLASKRTHTEIENSVRRWGRYSESYRELAAWRLEAISPANGFGYRTPLRIHQLDVAAWVSEGPKREAAQAKAASKIGKAA